MSDSNHEKSVELKNPYLAALLAFLIPGAGHWYQGRFFKAGIYSFCILGLFFSGMAMADWQAVKPPAKGERGKLEKLKYFGQMGVGLPAMYGLVQRERYDSPNNRRPETIENPITAPFYGDIYYFGDEVTDEVFPINGEISLVAAKAEFGGNTISGSFTGLVDGEERTFELGNAIDLDKPIRASRERYLDAEVIEEIEGEQRRVGSIVGSIPRPFLNWFMVPMDEDEVQELHSRLGKYHELAMVMTWIAGLLNLLAIWDAFEGPAYGYDDTFETGEADEIDDKST